MTGLHLGTDSIHEICRQAYNTYFHSNAFLASSDSGFARIQREVLSWTLDLLNGNPGGAANITSGGSESIFCAVHAAREWAKKHRPDVLGPYEIVMPRTAHAAYDKAAHYQGLEIVRVDVGDDLRADTVALEAAISNRTIMLVASAPSWGFGLLDPVPAIGELAQQHDLWLHVDCCVGGFLLPFLEQLGHSLPLFDFRVPGVSSISADLHKHAYAAKPASVVAYRSEALQRHHYAGVTITDWQSGTYKTHGVTGSRPASPVAAAWAVISVLGEPGYLELARQSLVVKDRLTAGIEAIEDFRVLPNESLLVPFRSEELDMKRVFGGLVERGYFPFGTFDPFFVHPSAEPVEDVVVDTFISDLAVIGAGVRDGSVSAEALATYSGS